jgi:hypothetical protein
MQVQGGNDEIELTVSQQVERWMSSAQCEALRVRLFLLFADDDEKEIGMLMLSPYDEYDKSISSEVVKLVGASDISEITFFDKQGEEFVVISLFSVAVSALKFMR